MSDRQYWPISHDSDRTVVGLFCTRYSGTYGHFDLEPAPKADLDAGARAAYDRSYEGYKLAYAE